MPAIAHPVPLPNRLVAGLAKIGMALRSGAWRAGEARGLTPTQGQILALLRARGKQPQRLASIAEGLAISAPTASEAVSALVRKGLVAKLRAPDDGRAVALKLTAAGKREAARSAQWPDLLLGAVGTLAAAEREVFLRAILKIIRTLQTSGEIPVSRLCLTCRHFQPNRHAQRPSAPHHCAFIDAAFGDRDLRLDCADHAEASETERDAAWLRFNAIPPQETNHG